MEITANLKVVLYANDVEIAHSTDPALWNHIFGIISNKQANPHNIAQTFETGQKANENSYSQNDIQNSDISAAISRLSARLDLTPDELISGCDFRDSAPYIVLEKKHYEAFRQNFPKKGKAAVNITKLSATLLVFWFEAAKLGNVTNDKVEAVNDTVHEIDYHTDRTIGNTSWLRVRSGSVVLNPTEFSKAINLLRAFFKKTGWEE